MGRSSRIRMHLLAAVLFLPWCSVDAHAGRPLAGHQELFPYTLCPALVEAICDAYAEDDTACDPVRALYEDYRSDARELAVRTQRNMSLVAGDRLDELLRELAPLTYRGPGPAAEEGQLIEYMREERRKQGDPRWKRVHRMTFDRAGQQVQGARAHDVLVDQWIIDAAIVLDLDDDVMNEFRGFVLRKLFFGACGGRWASTILDFSPTIDLTDAVQHALQIALPGADPPDAVEDALDRELQRIREEYHRRLAQYIPHHRERRHQIVLLAHHRQPAWVHDDERARRTNQRERAWHWRRQYDLLRFAWLEVEAALWDHFGEDAAIRWREHVYSRFCPQFACPRWPIQMAEWLESRDDATPGQIEFAERLVAEYQRQWRVALREPIEIIARLNSRPIAWQWRDEPPRDAERYVDAVFALHEISKRTIRRLEHVLTQSQREALRSALQGADPKAFGPTGPYAQLFERFDRGDERNALPWE